MLERPMASRLPKDELELSEDEWRNWMLFQSWKRTHLANERKFIAWVRTSVALLTLGFIVQRIELFLTNADSGIRGYRLSAVATWIPRLFFVLGGLGIVIGTLEFFWDRKRIRTGDMSRSPLLDPLIVTTLLVVLVISLLFLLPQP